MTSNAAPRMSAWARPILTGLIILAAGVVPWLLLAPVNRRVQPDLPWAALAYAAWLVLLVGWLGGFGWPRGTSEERRRRLRLWPPVRAEAAPDALSTSAIVGSLGLLYVVWILIGTQSAPPDLSAYPTTAYRWSMFLVGGVMSGVVEESAYRGYMQTGLERIAPDQAILVTSLVFVLSHVTQGLGTLVLLGPGLFVASLLYGALARQTGTILPGMVIHVFGDLAHTFFGVLRGDPDLLFVP